MVSSIPAAAVLAACLVLTGCEELSGWGDSTRFKEDFHYNYTLKPGGRLSVESLNGSVEVTGWDGDKVEISGTRYASTEPLMKAVRIDIVSSEDFLRIRTVPPSGHRGGMGARYVIHVPRQTQIERIVSSNGRIQIADIESAARLRTSNGTVHVNHTKGNLEVETSNGSVELDDHVGAAVVHTSNGAVRAQQVRGYFEATTSNGSINATLADPEPGRPVKLESSNGSITIALQSMKNNDIRATTSNSSITVKLPESAGAQLKAHTSNSSIHMDFDVTTRGALSKNSIEGTIGSGGPSIDLSTSNGSIRVQKL